MMYPKPLVEDGAFSPPGIDVIVSERNIARTEAITNVTMSAISGRAFRFSASFFHPFLSVELTVNCGAELPPPFSTGCIEYW